MPIIEVDGRSLNYVETGSAAMGPTLILLHGAGGSHLVWPEALQRIERIRTLAVDLPGHGQSQPPGRRTVDAYAAVIEEFAGRLALEQLVLVGHSLGSAVALTLALRDRVAIDGLILLGAAARMPVSDVLLGGSLASLERAADFVAEHGFGAPSPDVQAGIRDQMLATGATTTFGDFLACSRFDLRARLVGINASTLIITGDRDRLTPLRFAQTLAAGIPNARLSIVEGTGHFAMLEQPEHIARLASDFLSQILVGRRHG